MAPFQPVKTSPKRNFPLLTVAFSYTTLDDHHLYCNITVFLCLQGDARYLISNSKDQTIKLWDVRKFSPKEGLAASRLAVTQQNWDYRWQQVPQRGEFGCLCQSVIKFSQNVIGINLWMQQNYVKRPLKWYIVNQISIVNNSN